jgi:hypothetical protein
VYHKGTTDAACYIPAGSELFKLHDTGWFESRPHFFDGNFALLVVASCNYEKAEYILRNMTAMKRGKKSPL